MQPGYDTVIVGGGPAGSTVASLLRKYAPDHRVLVLEREEFPRDHVGESQLPLIGAYLHEMGAWVKVEEAGFPIKVGATYRWGSTDDLWHFNFVPDAILKEEPRPGSYSGERELTAFQVDRSIYDKILLDHAACLGAEVKQGARVVEVLHEGDLVTGLRLDSGETVVARHYVDASGGSGLLRRALGVEIESPTALRNIAIWDYWQNAEWAEEIGVGGTRVQVMSLGYGWIWFIPLGPTRTSVGLVVPVSYYRDSGIRPADLYGRALKEESRISGLLERATREGSLQTTNDWSYVADRLYGDNWLLAGDACGFADPILAAGMTLAHGSAREVAYTILELDRGEHDPAWLKTTYDELHRRRIKQHIRFADYWYTANACFTDLKAFTSEIARDAGLSLDPDQAFQWLGTGGFANDDLGQASIGAYTLGVVKQITQQFSGASADWMLNKVNQLQLDMAGVHKEERPYYHEGRILRVLAYVKEGRVLPLLGPFRIAVTALQRERDLGAIIRRMSDLVPQGQMREAALLACVHALEGMLAEGWVKGRVDKKRPVGQGLRTEENSSSMAYASKDSVAGLN